MRSSLFYSHREEVYLKQLLIASTNRGKLREIQAILNGLPFELLLPEDISIQLDVAETGQTYAENAALKARAYCQASGLLTLADDSGLEVEALGGAPGIFSARFSPKPNAQDADRRAYLLEQLQGRPRPWPASFHCAVAIAAPSGECYYAEGICPGEIIDQERGSHGFGYDPLFFLVEYGCTMAELDPEVKNRISHRARALQAALPILARLVD
jgi:XTP/dITP diphosphohydrolase